MSLSTFSVHRPVYREVTPVGVTSRCRFSYVLTNERTHEEITYDANKSSLTDTCACVQDFCNLDDRATTTPTEEKTA